jgi:hypothetical protein
MKNKPRKPKGISGSAMRRIERIAKLGDRAVFRQFVATDRRALKEGGLTCE